MSLHGEKKIKILFQAIMTFLMFIGIFVTLNSLMKHPFPAESKDIIVMVIGYVSGAFSMCMSFWFGTSSSSHDKDKMIFNSTPIDEKKDNQ